MFGGIAAIAGGVLGGIGGAAGSGTSSNTNTSSTSSVSLRDFEDLNKGRSALETSGYNTQLNQLGALQNLVNAGPGQQAITDYGSASNQYADILQQFMSGGGLPTANQVSQSQNYASQIFNPQQVALQQSFTQQSQQAARDAARLGRSNLDPVLRNKLSVSQTQQQALLNAQQGAFAAQTAQQMPQQQISAAEALYGLRQNLASQAFNNRQTLLGLGQSLANSERQYRLDTATKTTNGSSQTSGSSGGGLGGMIGGALAGIGGFAQASGTLSSMFNSKSGGMQLPANNPNPNMMNA